MKAAWNALRPSSIVWVCVAGFLLCAQPPLSSDAFGFLPVKDARRAREGLAALDASLAVWEGIQRGFSAEARRASAALESRSDAEAYKALLTSALDGSWKAEARGPSMLEAEKALHAGADRLASILEPWIDRADEAALGGLQGELMKRARGLSGSVPEYLALIESLSKAGLPARRFAVRALLGVSPASMALRLFPQGKAMEALPYGASPELLEEARRVKKESEAIAALRASAPAMAVPELPWTREESLRVEEASKLLSALTPAASWGALESGAGIPGPEILPAFLSGLSREDRLRWRLERGLPQEALGALLALAPDGAAPIQAAGSGAAELSTAMGLSALEREAARGASGAGLLASLTDPALRAALVQQSLPSGLQAARAEAIEALKRGLALELSSGEANKTEPGVFYIEAEEASGLGGFVFLRAYAELPDGTRRDVSMDRLEEALERVLPDPAAAGGEDGKAARLGFLAVDGSEDAAERALRSSWDREKDPSAWAALGALLSARLREAARKAGVSPLLVYPGGLYAIEDVSYRRCLGQALDEEVRAGMGGVERRGRASSLWDEAYRRLTATRRALALYSGDPRP